MTFTNRLGQDISIKLNTGDEPKVLLAFDSRVSFVHCRADGADQLQVSRLNALLKSNLVSRYVPLS